MAIYLHIRNVVRRRLKGSVLGRLLLSTVEKPHTGRIHVISATRLEEPQFWRDSALGQSLLSWRNHPELVFHISYANKSGLPSVYNEHINSKNQRDILLFVHDDVWLDVDDWANRIRKGLGRFDVLGVAGNRRLGPKQPAWAFHTIDTQGFHWDTAFLSGQVAHGKKGGGSVMRYGPVPMECQALDGVLIAARCDNLLKAKVRFDERFKFHFYDLDFCRSASMAKLLMATWDIPITHQSGGAFGSTEWHMGYRKYLDKWNGRHTP